MATKTIGATGRDYATFALHIAYLDALDTLTEPEIGEAYNDAEFVVAGGVAAYSGFVADATNKVTIRPAAGQGFADHADAATNPLKYDASKGVALRCTGAYSRVAAIAVSHVELIGLQMQLDNASAFQAFLVDSSSLSGILVDKCVIDKKQGSNDAVARLRSGTIRSSLLIQRVSGASAHGIDFNFAGTVAATDCTVVRPSDITAAANAFNRDGGTPAVTGCASFGFTNFSDDTTYTGSNNASDTTIGFGTSNQASKTYANQFEGTAVAAMDFRAKSVGDLIDNGTGSLSDIIGQAVSGGTRDIGAWELQAGGGGSVVAIWNPMVGPLEPPNLVVL